MISYYTRDIHISLIKHGDTILHNGELKTVSRDYIKNGFFGRAVFGDSYKSGTAPVKLVIFLKA